MRLALAALILAGTALALCAPTPLREAVALGVFIGAGGIAAGPLGALFGFAIGALLVVGMT